MFGNDRNSLRRSYSTVWEKVRAGQRLEPLEQIIARVVCAHPEYQTVLIDSEAALKREYTPGLGETNPFLHMGMHIAIQEQLGGDRPTGILDVYQQLCQRVGDNHTTEHQMMECLGEALWEAQRNDKEPDANVYLERLRRLWRS